jgi:MFS family permease
MSPLELRAGVSLASLFALRMLGLFLILPVFAVHAHQLSGGDSRTLVGMALGAYGLTQAILQIPYGMASDRYGRKRMIVIGLSLFALGSFLAAWASDIHVVILGRAMQGMGAIAAPVMALAADITREEHRTKAMAMIGGSIGLTFAVSLVAAPVLYQGIGMTGIFGLTGLLSLAAIWVTLGVVPAEPAGTGNSIRRDRKETLGEVLRNVEQLRLNFGIFSLHAVQMAIFVVVPVALVDHGGLPVSEHWKIYLPVVLGSFLLMAPPLLHAERRGRMKFVFLSAIALLLAVEIGFAVCYTNFRMVIALLLAFFVAFKILEASLPSPGRFALFARCCARRVQHDPGAGPVRRRRDRRLAGAAFRGGVGVCIRNRGCCVMAGSGLGHAHRGQFRGADLFHACRGRSGRAAREARSSARRARGGGGARRRHCPINGVS